MPPDDGYLPTTRSSVELGNMRGYSSGRMSSLPLVHQFSEAEKFRGSAVSTGSVGEHLPSQGAEKVDPASGDSAGSGAENSSKLEDVALAMQETDLSPYVQPSFVSRVGSLVLACARPLLVGSAGALLGALELASVAVCLLLLLAAAHVPARGSADAEILNAGVLAVSTLAGTLAGLVLSVWAARSGLLGRAFSGRPGGGTADKAVRGIRVNTAGGGRLRVFWLRAVAALAVAPLSATLCLFVPSEPQTALLDTLRPLLAIGLGWSGGVELPAGYCASFGAAPLLQGGGPSRGQAVRQLSEAVDGGGESGRKPLQRLSPGWWRRWGDTKAGAAAALVANMTRAEAGRLVQGFGWAGFSLPEGLYTGSVLGVPRLGLPGLHMQDAAQGYRTMFDSQVGTVTAWPSLLSFAASWDASLTREFASALGREFRAKGANVILGPSVNVHRVARNGRNAEYLSGEEPRLGEVLVAAYVQGVQSEKVAAVVKHYALNNQETHRATVDVEVDERTRREVYYPPFEAAVRAGVASFMCSYNLVDGEHACGSEALSSELRDGLGFADGWMMSDWWAVHSSDAARGGVDQNMPGNDGWFDLYRLGGASGESDSRPHGLVGQMAERVVRGALAADAYDAMPCHVGCDCGPLMMDGVSTSAEHRALARRAAASSVVLLKNEGVLPLQRDPPAGRLRIALLGSACAAPSAWQSRAAREDWAAGDYYTVGGSGRVFFPGDASLLAGLEAAGYDVALHPVDRSSDAEAAMRGFDVAIACGGGVTQESRDRPSLRLDQDHFLQQLVARTRASRSVDAPPHVRLPPLIVVALAPGAILTSWAEHADAALVLFLGGEATGLALSDVLSGHVSPSGRLPLTLPAAEADATPPCAGLSCSYTEGLALAWRGLHKRPVAFPFGHGLSYTRFSYSWETEPAPSAGGGATLDGRGDAQQPLFNLSFRVQNDGAREGQEVAQLYLSYPESAGEPPLVLRHFVKTRPLQPSQSELVSLSLSRRDLSTWRPADSSSERGGWRVAHGRFGVVVGGSSRPAEGEGLRAEFEV